MSTNPNFPLPTSPVASKKSHKLRWILLSALAVILLIVVIAVSTSGRPSPGSGSAPAVPPVVTAAPTTSAAPKAMAVPTIYGMTEDAATTALASAGFTSTPNFVDSSGGTIFDTTGYTVKSISDTSSAITAAQPDDSFTITMVLAHPCQYDNKIPADSDACVNPNSTVVYKISGASSALITYNAEDGAIEQQSDAALPWSKSYTVPSGGSNFWLISAQNSGGGSISCSITVDGTVVSHHTSTGDYAIVDCQQ